MSDFRTTLFAAVFFVAFSSIYVQFPGLYGTNGVLPVQTFLESMKERNGLTKASLFTRMQTFPTLMWLAEPLNIHSDVFLDFLGLSGILISFLVLMIRQLRAKLVFAILWILYFSIYQVGQTFMHFQWDILLLECGFLFIFYQDSWFYDSGESVPYDGSCIIRVMFVFLSFKLMFLSGIVKLLSECPTWWGLSALKYHFESQCIPTPLAYYAHTYMPQWMLSLGVVYTFVLMIVVSFLFFSPVRGLRVLAFILHAAEQVMILATGNYNFFNLLTILLVSFILYKGPSLHRDESLIAAMLSYALTLAVPIFLILATVHYFTLRFVAGTTLGTSSVSAKIAFSHKDFDQFVTKGLLVGMGAGAAMLISTIAYAFWKCRRVKVFFNLLVCTIVACLVFGASLDAMASNDSRFPLKDNKFWVHGPTAAYEMLNRYEVANSYGLFRRMTGVGARPEVIVEGASSLDGPWVEINFKYKPGEVARAPPFIAPHQPRLDWQMWFAALGSYQYNPWLVHMMAILLDQPTKSNDVWKLLGHNKNSTFTYLRANLYDYHYAVPSKAVGGAWWARKMKSVYIPPISKNQISEIKSQLGHDKLKHLDQSQCSASPLCLAVKYLRDTQQEMLFIASLVMLFFTKIILSLFQLF